MIRIILSAIILFSLSGFASAEDALKAKIEAAENVLQLDFQQAVKMAVEKNQKIKAFKSRVNAQESFIGVERGNFLPSVNFNQGFVFTNNPAEVFSLKLNQQSITSADFAGAPGSFNAPGEQTNFLSEITLEQSLYNKGNFLRLKIAKTQHNAGQSEYLRTKEKVVLEVARAYLNVKNSEKYLEVAEKSIESAKEHNRIANVRYKNELGLYSDVLRTNTFLKKAEQRLVSAQKNYEVAKKALGLTIGIPNSVEVGNNAPEIAPFSLKIHKDKALQRSDIKAIEINYENAKNSLKLKKSLYFPELKAGGNYQIYSEDAPFGFEGDNFRLYGALNWNLFSGNKRHYLVKIAEYELEQAKEMLHDAKNTAEFEVFDAYQAVNEKSKNLELSESALSSAEEGMKLVEVRYKNSLSPIIDILDAQLNLDQARADLVNSRNEYLFALLNLSYMSGNILNDLGLKEEEL